MTNGEAARVLEEMKGRRLFNGYLEREDVNEALEIALNVLQESQEEITIQEAAVYFERNVDYLRWLIKSNKTANLAAARCEMEASRLAAIALREQEERREPQKAAFGEEKWVGCRDFNGRPHKKLLPDPPKVKPFLPEAQEEKGEEQNDGI